MASGDILGRIADQETLEALKNGIGNTDDTGGTYNSGTLNSKANAALLGIGGVNNGIDGINSRLDGVVTPYGKGTYGDLIFGSDFVWPSQDGFNRYVIHTKSMTIPEGVTLTPPEKCDGVYILSQGDVTINGTIDLRGKRKTLTEALQLASTINVGSQEFELAKGGYAPKGGANGAGGNANTSWSGIEGDKIPSPSLETNSIAGNVNGGGVGSYGLGGSSVLVQYGGSGDKDKNYNYMAGVTDRKGVYYRFIPELVYNEAPGALVIIAKGKVTINGTILCSGNSGKAPTDASDYSYSIWQGPSSNDEINFTLAGDGAMPPSGGGAVTIICDTFSINGEIDTNGKKEVYSDKPDKRNTLMTKVYTVRGSTSTPTITETHEDILYLSQGGFGGTFISTAGDIKVYTGVSE